MPKKILKEQYHHGDLRSAILATADSILSDQGSDTISMREVARLLKVSHGAPYRHFVDKDSIFAALAEEGFRELSHEHEKILSQKHMDSRERLKGLAKNYSLLAARKPQLFRLMFEQLPSIGKIKGSPLFEESQTCFAKLTQAIAHAQSEDKIDKTRSPELFAFALMAMIHGFLSLALKQGAAVSQSQKVSLTNLEDFCLDTLLKGSL